MENYMVIRGEKIELSEETVRNLEEKFGIKKKRWVPKPNERYWTVGGSGKVVEDKHDEIKTDYGRIEIGNAFRTEEEGELIVRKLKSLKRIMDWKWENQGDWKPDWKDRMYEKYFILYNHSTNCFETTSRATNQFDLLIGHFRIEDIADKCIAECESDLKIIFDIE